MVYILIAILMFGMLIAIHEFGHFITAKLLGVRVEEFSIGMGPQLLSRMRGETRYTLRLLPIGGFCAMEGEEEDTDSPGSFQSKPVWARLIILAAGAFLNFVTGLLIVLILFVPAKGFRMETVGGFLEGYGIEGCGIQPGDRFLAVDGQPVLVYGDAAFLLGRAGDTVDFLVLRDGEKVEVEAQIPYQEKDTEEGHTRLRGIQLGTEVRPATPLVTVEMAARQSLDYVRMVWYSLGDLIRGAVGFRDLSGPIGIVSAIGQVGSQAETTAQAFTGIMTLVAFIAINLAVMNLLPIPALDGGRIFFLLVGAVVRLFTHEKLDPKYENAVNMAGFFCLLALMVVVAINDISKLIR